MLKTIQILGCSSGLVKPQTHTYSRLSFISSISTKPFSFNSSSSYSCSRPTHFLFPGPSTRRTRFGAFSMSSAHSGSNPAAPSSSSTVVPSVGNAHRIKFCQWCGGATKHEIPDGDEKIRAICTVCDKIAYENPKMVVGCLIGHDNIVLLCKRNIQPSFGLWTLPAGYLEIGESAAEGAIRETWEEACAEVEVVSPFPQLDIPLIGQTYVIFLAKLKKAQFSPGPESSECRLFAIDDIPFDSLSFSSMVVTLKLYAEDVKAGKLKFHYGTINKSVDKMSNGLTCSFKSNCGHGRGHLFLLFMSFSLAVEVLHAFIQDESEHKHYLIVSAVTNLLVNLIGVWFFRNYARINLVYRNAEDMNNHSVCLHVLADSIRRICFQCGLILASWFLSLGVQNAEVLCFGLVAVAVFMLVMPLFKATGGILLQMAPPNVPTSALSKCWRQIAAREDVSEVSQAWFWEVVPGHVVGSLSVQVKKGIDDRPVLQLVHGLYDDLGIQDLTVQTEFV